MTSGKRATSLRRFLIEKSLVGHQVETLGDKLLLLLYFISHDFIFTQVRKLEFLLADALHQGCDSVVTCGSIQSNHARATAVAAAQLGLKPHLLLRWPGTMVS